ncbi:MAG: amidohydrolase family protein [Bdellovibrionota bacterium]
MTTDVKSRGPVDAHVHVVGNGLNGSGCWLRLSGWNRVLARMMLRELGLPPDALHGDLERHYADRLIQYVRSSSLTAVVILAHEQVYDAAGKLLPQLGSMYIPNDYVLDLAARYPNELLPAVSIHPARPDALDELARTVEQGAVMMKCLPNCQNIDCSNPRYKRFWQAMSDYGLPLLAHTGGELTVQVVERKYEDPKLLRSVLDCGVTVIAAHVASRSYPLGIDYFPDFCRMCEQYPNLYGDNSALNSPFRSAVLPKLMDGVVRDRIIHGSDLPIPISGRYAYLRGMLSRADWKRWGKTENLLERDYQYKRAMGFGEDTFTRIWQLLRIDSEPRQLH